MACKLHAWLDRRDQRADKRGSDGLDMCRLLATADWDAFAADAGEIDGFGAVIAWGANAVLVEQAARVSRLIQVHTATIPPSPDEIEALGRLLVDLT